VKVREGSWSSWSSSVRQVREVRIHEPKRTRRT
jgi:hypothetical protein